MDAVLTGFLLAIALFLLFCLFIATRSNRTADGLVEARSSLDRAACHEAGHALVAWDSQFVERVTSVSIATAGGGEVLRSRSSRHTTTMLWDDMVIALAGIAGEAEMLQTIFTQEARGDLNKALTSAKELAAHERTIKATCLTPWEPSYVTLTDVTEFYQDTPLSPPERRILNHAFQRAMQLTRRGRSRLETLMRALRKRRMLDTADLRKLLGPRPALIRCSIPPNAPPSSP